MTKPSSNEGVRTPGVKVTTRPPAKKRTKKVDAIVNRSMTVEDIVGRYPQTTTILAMYGLHCFGCAASGLETIEEGCRGHGFSEEDIDTLITDLNEAISDLPPRPMTLAITDSAAKRIADIATAEGKEDEGLVVEADEHGGFYLEFRKNEEKGDHTFTAAYGVKVFASALTLQRIGGATIDFREGRFKLDVDTPKACACGGESCGCGGACKHEAGVH